MIASMSCFVQHVLLSCSVAGYVSQICMVGQVFVGERTLIRTYILQGCVWCQP